MKMLDNQMEKNHGTLSLYVVTAGKLECTEMEKLTTGVGWNGWNGW